MCAAVLAALALASCGGSDEGSEDALALALQTQTLIDRDGDEIDVDGGGDGKQGEDGDAIAPGAGDEDQVKALVEDVYEDMAVRDLAGVCAALLPSDRRRYASVGSVAAAAEGEPASCESGIESLFSFIHIGRSAQVLGARIGAVEVKPKRGEATVMVTFAEMPVTVSAVKREGRWYLAEGAMPIPSDPVIATEQDEGTADEKETVADRSKGFMVALGNGDAAEACKAVIVSRMGDDGEETCERQYAETLAAKNAADLERVGTTNVKDITIKDGYATAMADRTQLALVKDGGEWYVTSFSWPEEPVPAPTPSE